MINKLSFDTAVKMGTMAHSVWREGGNDSDGPRNGHHHRKIYESDNAEVCLTCTKKVCQGGEDCFRSRKKKLRDGGP